MAKDGTGATFQLSATAIVGTAGELAELTSVPLPSVERDLIETTNHGSGGWEENIKSAIKRQAERTLGLHLLSGSTTDTTAEAAVLSDALYYYKITIPGATTDRTYSGQCHVLSYEKDDVQVGEKMTASITIKPQGAFTVADAA